jgi:hypothetical protein
MSREDNAAAIRRWIATALALFACATAGCDNREYAPARIAPLASRPPTPLPTVAVSAVFSTGWVWMPLALTHHLNANYDNLVRIERIELVDPNQPTLYVPKTSSTLIWGLMFYNSEDPGCALFRPGYEPAFNDFAYHTPGVTWDPHPWYGRAIFTAHALAPSTSQASVPTTSPINSVEAPAQPANDALKLLLAKPTFWRALRQRYEANEDREPIRIICKAMTQAADHRAATHSGLEVPDDSARVLDWCRSIAAQIDHR